MTIHLGCLVPAIRRKPILFLLGATLVLGAQSGAFAGRQAHAASAPLRTPLDWAADAARGSPADVCTLVQRGEILPFLAKGQRFTMHVNQAPVTRYICIYEVKYLGKHTNYDHFTIALELDSARLMTDGDYKPFKGVGTGSYLHRDASDGPGGRDLAELLVRKGGIWFVMSVGFDVAGRRSALIASEALARRVLSRL